jgi:hypothetical protein
MPPPGFDGWRGGEWGDHNYERACTPEEAELLNADLAAAEVEERSEDEQLREAWFAMLRASVTETDAQPAGELPSEHMGAEANEQQDRGNVPNDQCELEADRAAAGIEAAMPRGYSGASGAGVSVADARLPAPGPKQDALPRRTARRRRMTAHFARARSDPPKILRCRCERDSLSNDWRCELPKSNCLRWCRAVSSVHS